MPLAEICVNFPFFISWLEYFPRIRSIADCHPKALPTFFSFLICRNMVKRQMASKKQIVRFLHILAETMEIPPRQLAGAALEYASSVFDSADSQGDAQVTEDEPLVGDDMETGGTYLTEVPPSTPYTGPLHLCLDFGTAMSKACAWDKESDTPMPLRIGLAAGEPASSPYAINSAIFISRDGLAFVGQAAINGAAAADPEHHQAFQSIKDILTVGPMTDLGDPVPALFNPNERSVSRKEIGRTVPGLPDR